MNINSRNLNFLLIDDNRVMINGFSSIAIDAYTIEIPYTAKYGTRSLKQVATWSEALQFISTEIAMDKYGPDLIIADCNFENDDKKPHKPPLGNGVFDSRGLLYGLIIAAVNYGKHPNKPFGFSIFSAAKAQAADDGWAQTILSILKALEGGFTFPHDESTKDKEHRFEVEVISERLLDHGSDKTAHQVIRQAMHDFRRSLFSYIEAHDAIHADGESFLKCASAIEMIVEGKMTLEDIADHSISWKRTFLDDLSADNVRLESFLCDFDLSSLRKTEVERLKVLGSKLEAIGQKAHQGQVLYSKYKNVLDKYFLEGDGVRRKLNTRDHEDDMIATLVMITLAVLECCSRDPDGTGGEEIPRTTSALKRNLYDIFSEYEENSYDQVFRRIFKRVFGRRDEPMTINTVREAVGNGNVEYFAGSEINEIDKVLSYVVSYIEDLPRIENIDNYENSRIKLVKHRQYQTFTAVEIERGRKPVFVSFAKYHWPKFIYDERSRSEHSPSNPVNKNLK